MHFKFHNVRARQKCTKFISRLFHTNVLWTIFLSQKNDKVLMVGYPRQIMFWSPSPGLATKWTGLEIHQNPWASAQTTQPVSESVCPRLHNKGQHIGEAIRIFLNTQFYQSPSKKLSVKIKLLKFNWNKKSPGCWFDCMGWGRHDICLMAPIWFFIWFQKT